MASNKEKGIALLNSKSSVNMYTNTTRTVLYTCPSGKDAVITQIVLRSPSATLAGCDDVNIGTGAGTTGTWKDAETGIGDMTATTDYMVLRYDSDEFTIIDGDDATLANREFNIYIVDGADSGSPTCTIDVFGYEF